MTILDLVDKLVNMDNEQDIKQLLKNFKNNINKDEV